MFLDDYGVYKVLVADQNKEHTLENLLAYHLYQDTKKDFVYDFVRTYRTAPTEKILSDALATEEILNRYRKDAHSEIQARIAVEIKSANKKDNYFKRVVDKALLDLSAKSLTYTVFFVLSYSVLQIILSFGLLKAILSIIQFFPSIKDKFCEICE